MLQEHANGGNSLTEMQTGGIKFGRNGRNMSSVDRKGGMRKGRRVVGNVPFYRTCWIEQKLDNKYGALTGTRTNGSLVVGRKANINNRSGGDDND